MERMRQLVPIPILVSICVSATLLSSCSMKEEMRRIEEVKKANANQAASRSTNLTGEQIFVRSCNTCHPGGDKGPYGPSLIDMDKDFPSDDQLKAFLRKGKGIMPPLPVSSINDQELDSLVQYLRAKNVDLHEEAARREERRKAREAKEAAEAAQKELDKHKPRSRRGR